MSANEMTTKIEELRELKAAGAAEIFIEYQHGDSKIKSQQAAVCGQGWRT